MEQGVNLVSSILGEEKSHLYPSILQLVMADGVFAEGNSRSKFFILRKRYKWNVSLIESLFEFDEYIRWNYSKLCLQKNLCRMCYAGRVICEINGSDLVSFSEA